MLEEIPSQLFQGKKTRYWEGLKNTIHTVSKGPRVGMWGKIRQFHWPFKRHYLLSPPEIYEYCQEETYQ